MAYNFDKAKQAINHATEVLKLLINDYRIISEQEMVLGTHALLGAVRSAKRYADDIEKYFKSSLIDEFKLDYHKLKYTFRSLAEQWDDTYYASASLSPFSYTIDGDIQLNTVQSMNTLLGTMDSANKDIVDMLNKIYKIFDDVDKQLEKYMEDDLQRRDTHEKAYYDHLDTNHFKPKKKHYIEDLTSYLTVHGNTYESHHVFCHDIENANNSLLSVALRGGDVSKYMVEHRTEISGLDVDSYYYLRYVYNDLQNRMKRFEYEKECESHYAGMFKSKAAEKLAIVFGQIFYNRIDRLSGNKYAMVMLAMKDMKIIEKGQYGQLFKDFVNSEILSQNGENLIADAKSITDITKKVKNHPFKHLTEDDLKDSSFNKNEFDRLSDFYWQCISIMNLVFEYDLHANGFANYLCEPHPSTPDISVFEDLRELKAISSVLKGERNTV